MTRYTVNSRTTFLVFVCLDIATGRLKNNLENNRILCRPLFVYNRTNSDGDDSIRYP